MEKQIKSVPFLETCCPWKCAKMKTDNTVDNKEKVQRGV